MKRNNYDELLLTATSEMNEEQKTAFHELLKVSKDPYKWLMETHLHPLEYRRVAQYSININNLFSKW